MKITREWGKFTLLPTSSRREIAPSIKRASWEETDFSRGGKWKHWTNFSRKKKSREKFSGRGGKFFSVFEHTKWELKTICYCQVSSVRHFHSLIFLALRRPLFSQKNRINCLVSRDRFWRWRLGLCMWRWSTDKKKLKTRDKFQISEYHSPSLLLLDDTFDDLFFMPTNNGGSSSTSWTRGRGSLPDFMSSETRLRWVWNTQ